MKEKSVKLKKKTWLKPKIREEKVGGVKGEGCILENFEGCCTAGGHEGACSGGGLFSS